MTVMLYSNQSQKKIFLDADPLAQEKSKKFYFGLIAVALFVLVISVIIIAFWDNQTIF
jgi:hypothetical protein